MPFRFQTQSQIQNPGKKLAVILFGLLSLRLAFLAIAPWGLHGDEAQYWAWSQEPAFGYFTKPPMIAWVIGATTSLFGNAEWAVRLAAPVLHIATSVMIFLSGRRLFSAEIGFWAALIYVLMPAVWLSSFIMSTDATLLLFWAIALHGWVCLRDGDGWGRVLQLGLALGFGLLAKYAMAFMIPVLILAALFDSPSRKALLGLKGFIVLILATVILTPNLMWNAAHEFATLSHTAENANLGKDLFHPDKVLKFLGDQFGVFGIIPFPMLLIALVASFTGRLARPVRWLALLSALPLLTITLEALLSRANANWAVTAYVSGPLLVALWATKSQRRLNWLKWGLIGQTAIILMIGGIASNETTVDAAHVNNAVKRLRAWPETSAIIREVASRDDFAYIATDNRLVFYDLNYYGARENNKTKQLDSQATLTMWSINASPAHHAHLTRALPETDKPVLIISHYHQYEDYFREDFETLIALDPIEINLGPDKTRHLKLWRGTGYKRTSREDRS